MKAVFDGGPRDGQEFRHDGAATVNCTTVDDGIARVHEYVATDETRTVYEYRGVTESWPATPPKLPDATWVDLLHNPWLDVTPEQRAMFRPQIDAYHAEQHRIIGETFLKVDHVEPVDPAPPHGYARAAIARMFDLDPEDLGEPNTRRQIARLFNVDPDNVVGLEVAPGYGYLLRSMMGAVADDDPRGPYTHTFTPGGYDADGNEVPEAGRWFTVQADEHGDMTMTYPVGELMFHVEHRRHVRLTTCIILAFMALILGAALADFIR